MKVSLDTMSNRKCKNKYGPHITANMICAGRAGKSACYGDSGGPLVTKENNGSFSLIGVISHGNGCGKVSILIQEVIEVYSSRYILYNYILLYIYLLI